MDEGKTSIRDGILQTLEEIGQGVPDPEPPQSYFMSSIEMSAMSVFENNGKLTRWMHEHLRVAALPLPAAAVFQAEERLLGQIDPPLNLRGVPATPLRRTLTRLRSELSGKG